MEIWTIGHSTRTIEEFLALLAEQRIEAVADVRRFPGSRRMPWFNSDAFANELKRHGIGYHHLVGLGGRRKPAPDSKNTVWRVDAFRAYADFLETPEFEAELGALLGIAAEHRTAIMCAEAVWWRCHRSILSDALKARGHTVLHILSPGKTEEHPYTPPARIVDGGLAYPDPTPPLPIGDT
jgi:uncharacterized protein (DUF488 family)